MTTSGLPDADELPSVFAKMETTRTADGTRHLRCLVCHAQATFPPNTISPPIEHESGCPVPAEIAAALEGLAAFDSIEHTRRRPS